jgi:hypothetical protein
VPLFQSLESPIRDASSRDAHLSARETRDSIDCLHDSNCLVVHFHVTSGGCISQSIGHVPMFGCKSVADIFQCSVAHNSECARPFSGNFYIFEGCQSLDGELIITRDLRGIFGLFEALFDCPCRRCRDPRIERLPISYRDGPPESRSLFTRSGFLERIKISRLSLVSPPWGDSPTA